jgi:hypothetical protein
MLGAELLQSQSGTAFNQSDTALVYFHQRLSQSELFECISDVNIVQVRIDIGPLTLIQLAGSSSLATVQVDGGRTRPPDGNIA